MIRLLLSLVLLSYLSTLSAQTEALSLWRTRQLRITQAEQSIDSLPIFPGSVSIFKGDTEVDSSQYHVRQSNIHWSKEFWKPGDSTLVAIRYKVLPYPLDKTFNHLDTTAIQIADDGSYIGWELSPYDPDQGLSDLKGLEYNGSFARGISFGNAQNLVLNSSFNLQMAGNLGEDVEILAAITDQNIPLQPEGNTQQLQEFDKIFIQLKKQEHTFIAGDYELRRPESYFMNYFKKLQGATYINERELTNDAQLKTMASGAVARGKFARNTINQIEGNQGPYKLFGGEGERFIIILAGTEKVYIDGALLQRGLEEDYVIDYNRADITFTAKRLITKDSRIIVEFEYADQNYLRSLYAFSSAYQNKKLKLNFNLYSEQDSRNSGSNQQLDSLDRIRLRTAGDGTDGIFGEGIDTLSEFNEFRITYKLVDTTYVVDGQGTLQAQILVYSSNPDSARFTASFLEVGFGNGDYVVDDRAAANGRAFKWVAPNSAGEAQGNYQIGRRLVAPTQLQMYSLGASYQLGPRSKVSTEIALSNNDQNRFSQLDDKDNVGVAVFTAFENRIPLSKKSTAWQLDNTLTYEFVQDNFRSLNPYRNAEFTRDWNLANQPNSPVSSNEIEQATEHLINGGLALTHNAGGKLAYDFSSFLRGADYNGFKHTAASRWRKGGFELNADGSLLNVESTGGDSRFFRPRIDFSKTFEQLGGWQLGAYGEREKNQRFHADSNTLTANSFYYDLYKVYIKSPENERFSIGGNYLQRADFTPVDTDFQQSTLADEVTINGRWNQGRSSQLQWLLTYRQLEIKNTDLTNQEPQETFLGRLEHSLNLFKGALRSTTNYQIGSGQEARVQVTYLKVNPGEGTHIWQDSLYNNDGQVQLNEMEIAPFQDIADYIRIVTITNEFIRTNNVQLNQSLRLDPRRLWYQKEGPLRFFSKFSTQSTLLINRKSREAPDVTAWNPFELSIADSALVAITSRIANTLFFNRSNPTYDLQVGQLDSRNRTVLTTGYESRRNSEQFFRSRWNISQQWSLQTYFAHAISQNDSEFFNVRDFSIRQYKAEPRLTFLPNRNFRTILTYKYKDSENTLGDVGERALQHDFTMETTYNRTSSTSIRLNLSFVRIAYDGPRNTPIEFAMLQGLQDGSNYLWNLALDRRLSQNIQLTISYEGRKTGEANTVHVGRAQVRATF